MVPAKKELLLVQIELLMVKSDALFDTKILLPLKQRQLDAKATVSVGGVGKLWLLFVCSAHVLCKHHTNMKILK